MRQFFITAAVLATLATAAVPATALAYTSRCEAQAHNKKVTGTVLGGVLGALAGNAIGSGGGRTGGTIIGGVAGAAIGNNLSRTHCPTGYTQRTYDERYYDVNQGRYRDGYNANRCNWRQERFRDDRGRWATRQVQYCR